LKTDFEFPVRIFVWPADYRAHTDRHEDHQPRQRDDEASDRGTDSNDGVAAASVDHQDDYA